LPMFDANGNVICKDCLSIMRRKAIEVDGAGVASVAFECTDCGSSLEYKPKRHDDTTPPRP